MNKWIPAFVLLCSYAPAALAEVNTRVAREADGTSTIIQEVTVNAPAAEVWNAVSTARGWQSWSVPIAWAPAPDIIETSYAADAKPGDPTTIRQEVLARVPERLLVFRTTKAPNGFPNFETYRKVLNSLELFPLGSGRTRVRLTASGFDPSPAGQRLLAFFTKGNAETFEKLEARFGASDVKTPAAFAPLAFLVGHCWIGRAPGDAGEDEHCFESVFGGQHVRDRHSVVKDGREVYAGETVYSRRPGALTFTYWNSLGGVGTGEALFDGREIRFTGTMRATAAGSEQPLAAVWRKVADGYEVRERPSDAPRLFKRAD